MWVGTAHIGVQSLKVRLPPLGIWAAKLVYSCFLTGANNAAPVSAPLVCFLPIGSLHGQSGTPAPTHGPVGAAIGRLSPVSRLVGHHDSECHLHNGMKKAPGQNPGAFFIYSGP